MSMRPMIIVGCGGSGGKVVQLLRQELELQLRRKGWTEGIPKAWQLVYVDTPATQEQGIPGVPTLPLADYVSVSGGFDDYGDVVTSLFNSYNGMEERFAGWLPEREIKVPLTDGAGQMRAVGRATSFSSLGHLSQRLQAAYDATLANSAELSQLYDSVNPGSESSETVANDQKPFVFVISSLAGGTGAGIFMDVCDVFRACDSDLRNRISGVLFSAEVFANLTNEPGLQPNSLAALSEIMAGYFNNHRPLEPLYKKEMSMATAYAGTSGPNYPYIIGTSTMGGVPLKEIMDCYRATTQTLASVMMNPKDIGYYFTQFAQTNWPQKQANNLVPWAFGNQSPINEMKGVFSSFGSATLSLGLRRMEEYAILRASRLVIDFQNHGWQALGHDAMGQPQASSEEVVEFLKQRHGPGFVSACELLEKDDEQGDRNDQVIDQLCSQEELDRRWLSFRSDVVNQLQSVGEDSPLNWQHAITRTVENQTERFLTDIRGVIAQGREEFVSATPARILDATSRAMARHGLRVALGLLEYTREDLSIARKQLDNEANRLRVKSGSKANLEAVFLDAPKKIPADNDVVRKAVRAAAEPAFWEALAEVRERASELILELQEQVVDPLVELLKQIQASLGDAPEVQQWPGSYGIPRQLVPPPLEFCLVESEKWPDLYVDLVSASASHDQEEGGWETILRTMVGAGGFTINRDGVEERVETAIEVKKGEHWSPRAAGGDGMSVKFEKHYEVEDVVVRAREWITRQGTAMGDFLDQGLMEYLNDTHADGNAVIDHQQRLNRFEQQLEKTLKASSPLVSIADGAALKVHPANAADVVSFSRVMEQLPLGSGHPAYSVASTVIEQTVFGAGAPAGAIDPYFGTERRGVESATCVSYLDSAVHPAAISSLMGPIVQAWNSSGDKGAFWMRRRARTLQEFVPVHPHVLRSMIRGWATGRMLGLVPDGTPEQGFSIKTEQGEARFPWPTVRGQIPTASGKVSWLPALLESIPLAFARYSTEPTILDAYDEIYLLGQTDRAGAAAGNPGNDYHRPGIEVEKFIRSGELHSRDAAVLEEKYAPSNAGASSPEEERKQRVLNYLQEFMDTLRRKTEGGVHQSNIWDLPDGVDLFSEVIDATEQMIHAVARFLSTSDEDTA